MVRFAVKLSVNAPCPCGSQKKYKKCCRIFHNGALAPNAQLLMKSRFSAYVADNANYIIKTTHRENPDYCENINTWKASILAFCQITEFEKLDILEVAEGKEESFVTFKATLLQEAKDCSFIEKSRFLYEDGIWLYHSGEFQ